MKLKISKNTQRVNRRIKWMTLAAMSVFALHYVIENGASYMQEYQFVEAGEDQTFEQDQVYSDYIKSATFQKELMIKEKRHGHKTWTLDHYRQYKLRRMQAMLTASAPPKKTVAKVMEEMKDVRDLGKDEKGDPKTWQQNFEDFDELTKKLKKKEHYKSQETKKVNGKDVVVTTWEFNGNEWQGYELQMSSQGYIEEYYGEERCYSGMINTPGVSLLPDGLMGFAYLMFLGYLFLGISISADIFMEAIDVITSQTSLVSSEPDEDGKVYQIELPIWNPTMANLSLMAFGSSAPEIILSVLEAVKDLGKPSGDLGPSTIVGSAAFNLLIISAVSIAAVGDGDNAVKKIDMMGVFLTTAFFSVFAYIWLFLCLSVNTPGEVTVEEASWTFGFFFILLILAFGTDKYASIKKKNLEKQMSKDELIRKNKRHQLRAISKKKGIQAVLNAAQGQKHENLKDNDIGNITQLYKDILETNDLSKVELDVLMSVLQPDSLFERFAARKAAGVGATKEFLDVKGQKFQVENELTNEVLEENEHFAFKCLHYSVSENAGTVKVAVIKKTSNADSMSVGVRTRDDTAQAEGRYDEREGKQMPPDYDHFDQVITMNKKDSERIIDITIHDNQDWQPDLVFYVELYDVKSNARLHGDDTECKITILDEDFPGKLAFDKTEIQASRNQDIINIVVKRIEGNDGIISCTLRTEPLLPDDVNNPQNAIEYEDYLPKKDYPVEFAHGESEKIVSIFFVNEKVPKLDETNEEKEPAFDEEEEDEEEEEVGPKFKVLIENPTPSNIKISKKNCCTVEIVSDSSAAQANEHANLITYFVQQNKPTWSYKFKKAVMLCPQVNEDDLIVDEVTLGEALTHFAIIGWNILFAFIPPVEWGGGWPAFAIALTFIGSITAIVAEVATVLGCTLGLKAAVTAITLVAVGTSLPDTSASMIAARQSEFADSAIGNVTGSNSVNVFVGLGLPWMISAIYQHKQVPEQIYETPPGNLAFSVMLFLITSVTCFIILGVRRATLGGELGGPPTSKYLSSIILTILWLTYVIMSSLKAYKVIEWDPKF